MAAMGRTGLRGRLALARKHWTLYLLFLAPFLILIFFHYIPMYGAQIAFRDYKPARGVLGSPWAGLKYVLKFVNGNQFWKLMRNTLSLNLYGLCTFPLSLILALMLNYTPSRRFQKTVQMVSYAPHFISTVVVCGMLLQFLDVRTGVIPRLLALFGVAPTSYMAKANCFPGIYVWSGVWQELGYGSIIYIAALAGVSAELHEAAIVDGAGILKRMWHVDIPGILPTFCILLILRCGSMMNVGFEKVLLLQNNLNAAVSEVISTYTYKIGLQSATPQYSYSAAIGLFTSVVNMVLLFGVNLLSKRLSGNGLW